MLTPLSRRATLHDLPSHLVLSADEKAVLVSYDHAVSDSYNEAEMQLTDAKGSA